MGTHLALLRGINVGTAKAVPMAELASVFEGLGYRDVTTVLRSGNVVFRSDSALEGDAAASIESAVRDATGVQSSVLLLSAERFAAIAAANPLLDIATDGSKSFVTFSEFFPERIEVPDPKDLEPEVLRVGEDAIYQWMPAGSLQTRVPRAFWKQFGSPLTARNWNTVCRLLALLK